MAGGATTAGQIELPRVRTLGTIGLRHDGRDTLFNGKPARAFAGLIAHRDGVTLEELVEVVWPERAPPSARSALHVHLGTLRHAMAAAPPGISIERSGPSYRLVLDGWIVDLDLVDLLVARGHQLVAEDSAAASDVFEHALSIWSGPALVVDDEPVSVALTSRYQLARLNAEEAHVESLLRAGRSEFAEDRAIAMIDAEPYRERRWAQLMRAQLGRDRAADALTTFRQARRRLVDDLGVEPGPELRSLERSILTRDLTSVEAPDELEPAPRPFGPLIGRQQLLERVESSLGAGVATVLLGPPGVGKTRLAVEVAARAVESPCRVGWVDLRNATFEDAGLSAQVEEWARSWPGSLVVLDNADVAFQLTLEMIGVIRRLAPSVGVLVTSRVPIGADCAVVPLRSLAVPRTDDSDEIESCDAVRLLRAMLGLLAPDTALSTETAARLCRQLGGLPLALRLAADLARTVPPAEVADMAERRTVSAITPAVSTVLEHLGSANRDAFVAVSTVSGAVDAELIGALAAVEPMPLVETLTEHGLMQFDPVDETAPYSILEPIREAGAALLTPQSRRRALDRLVDHCLERAESWSIALSSTTRSGEALSTAIRRELPWHRQAMAHLVEEGDADRGLRLASALEFPLYGLGWWSQNIELQDAALSIPGPPSSLRANVHAARGRPGLLHQIDEGQLVEAMEMARRVGDPATAAKAQHLLGICWWSQGRFDDAIRSFESAGAAAARASDPFTEIECRRYMGVALVTAGDHERGFELQTDVLESQQRRRGTELHVPHIRMYLGHCRRHVGDDDAAIADLEASRADYERIGNRASLIHILAGLAELYTDAGSTVRALDRAARALELSASTRITTYDAWILCSTARAHASSGDLEHARSAALAAASSATLNWRGEQHRVAAELAAVSLLLGSVETAARLTGLADASPDRRELPFRSPEEAARVASMRTVTRERLGRRYEKCRSFGRTATLGEAISLLDVDDR